MIDSLSLEKMTKMFNWFAAESGGPVATEEEFANGFKEISKNLTKESVIRELSQQECTLLFASYKANKSLVTKLLSLRKQGFDTVSSAPAGIYLYTVTQFVDVASKLLSASVMVDSIEVRERITNANMSVGIALVDDALCFVLLTAQEKAEMFGDDAPAQRVKENFMGSMDDIVNSFDLAGWKPGNKIQ
jgi:hypothetical protein